MTQSDRLREVLESDQLVEQLAAIEHARWAHWQRYVHDQCEPQGDGALVIPAALVERWEAQIETSYADLTEREKSSDREQVQKYLPTVIDALTR